MNKITAILIISTIMLCNCANEQPQLKEPSAEKMSLKVENDKTLSATEEAEEIETTEEVPPKVQSKTKDIQSEKSVQYDDVDVRVEASNKGWADMQFEERTYYFGTIEEGDIVKHSFKFKNIGTGDLLINDARATCGCTRPDYPFLPIAPQEEGEINVAFNSTGKFGMQRKSITVFSNSSPKVTVVYLEGKVVKKGELTDPVVEEKPEIQADTTSN